MVAEVEDWERLAELLDDDDSVRDAVRAAVAAGDVPWDALLDALDEAGALAYLQAGDTGMELADALAQLPRVFKVQPDLDEVTDTDDLMDATRLADRLLAHDGLRIVRLVEEDDSWPLVVVPVEHMEDVVSRISELGEAAHLGG